GQRSGGAMQLEGKHGGAWQADAQSCPGASGGGGGCAGALEYANVRTNVQRSGNVRIDYHIIDRRIGQVGCSGTRAVRYCATHIRPGCSAIRGFEEMALGVVSGALYKGKS